MPKIPFQPAEVDVPGVGANVNIPIGSAGLPGEALQRTGDIAERGIAANLAEYNQIKRQKEIANQVWLERVRVAQNHSDAAKTEADMARDAVALEDMAKYTIDPQTGERVRRTDFANIVEEVNLYNEKARKQYEANFFYKEGFDAISPKIDHHIAQTEIKARELAWEAQKRKWNDDWITNVQAMKDYYAYSADKDAVGSFETTTKELISQGVITAQQGETGIKEIKRGGDLQRAKNSIDDDPDKWVGNVNPSENYPFLSDNDFRDLNRYAAQQARELRIQKRQAVQEAQESNTGKILAARGKAIEGGKVFGMKYLDAMAFDQKGDLIITPQSYHQLQQNAIADQERADRGERRQPEMTPELWVKYGKVSEDIIWGRSSYADIAKLGSILPDAQMKTLMAMQGSIERKDVKDTTKGPPETPEHKVYKAGVYKYVDSFKPMMSKEMHGELRHEIDALVLDPKIEPEDYMDKAKVILQKYQADAFKRKLTDSLGWISGPKKSDLPTSEPVKPQVSDKIVNGVKYKKVNGDWYKEKTL
jgi:hypothetical protein